MVARIPIEVDDVLQFVEEIADDVVFASKAMMRDLAEAWECWRIEAPVKGTRALHRGHVVSGDPRDIVQGEVDAYRRLWKATDTAPFAWFPDRTTCTRLTPDQIRKVVRTFPAGTASSFDRFHPRHALLLGDSGLEVLSSIWAISEAIGMLPKQLCWIQMPMLGKPTGGNRLIILYAGMYRVWQRARRSVVAGVIDSLERKFWGASRG
eukprot:9499977-Pyramimonas_sp.AAC.1